MALRLLSSRSFAAMDTITLPPLHINIDEYELFSLNKEAYGQYIFSKEHYHFAVTAFDYYFLFCCYIGMFRFLASAQWL